MKKQTILSRFIMIIIGILSVIITSFIFGYKLNNIMFYVSSILIIIIGAFLLEYFVVGRFKIRYKRIGILAEELDPNDITLTFVIKNNSKTKKGTARMFLANMGLNESYNESQNISVRLLESSHFEIKTKSLASPFIIESVLIVVEKDPNQFCQPFSIIKRSPFGSIYTRMWQPERYKDPRDFDGKMVKTDKLRMIISGDSGIELDILPDEQVRIIMSVTRIVDLTKLLESIKDRINHNLLIRDMHNEKYINPKLKKIRLFIKSILNKIKNFLKFKKSK